MVDVYIYILTCSFRGGQRFIAGYVAGVLASSLNTVSTRIMPTTVFVTLCEGLHVRSYILHPNSNETFDSRLSYLRITFPMKMKIDFCPLLFSTSSILLAINI